MNNKDPKNYVANYELNDYRYSDFWAGREYEHKAEVMLLSKLFNAYLPDLAKREIIDLGGAYGRLAPLYSESAKHIILADYSTRELLEGAGKIVQLPYREKVSFLALNAYKMPFPDSRVDSLLSVRVMHHLKDISLFWTELNRVLVPGGVAIIEFANKNHILAILRHVLRLDIFSYLKRGVQQVTHQEKGSQGMKDGQVSIMYNFSPSYIKEISKKNGLIVEGMFACSFLRSRLLKRLFSLETLLKIEGYLQRAIPHSLVTPSIVVVLRKPGDFSEESNPLMQQLVCPTCNSKLTLRKDVLICTKKHEFRQMKVGVVDLRDPRPEDVDF